MIQRIPDKPPIIYPVKQGTNEILPKWSIMIPVYNCSRFLPETLNSVLEQCLSPNLMQIEVIDDCSTDADVEKLVLEIGQGRIGYYKQSGNVGSILNFHTCIKRAKGELIHLLHGDDRILPGFYQKMGSLFVQYISIGAAFCRHEYIDENSALMFTSDLEKSEDGILSDWLFRLFQHQRIQTPSIVVKRTVYEELGSFYAVKYGEDWEMWLRIAAKYSFCYTPDILASYRIHIDSISGQEVLNGQNIRDLKKVMSIAIHSLPENRKLEALSSAKKFYAHYAIRTANRLWKKYGDANAARAQIKEAFQLSIDKKIVFETVKIFLKIALNKR